jgi:hypothetical protein
MLCFWGFLVDATQTQRVPSPFWGKRVEIPDERKYPFLGESND